MLRRLLGALAVVVIALAGAIAILLVFQSRDGATTDSGGNRGTATTAAGPGVVAPNATSALLRLGNVELRYGPAADRAPLLALARSEAGPDSTALRAAGGAVVVRHDASVRGVSAQAYRRTLTATSPRDPQLQAFVEAWLGNGG